LGEDEANLKQPLVEGGRVYVTHRGVVRCLDNITGAELWKFSPENAAVTTAPVSWQDIIVVGATNATVYALDAGTGDPIWERICAAAIAPSPVLLEDVLLVGAGHMVYALSPQSGEATWICSLTAPAESGPVCDGGMAYFLCHGGSLQCVDASQGRYRWTANLVTGPRTFPLTVARRRVIVASGYRIQGVARSGAVAWTAEMPAGVGAAPVLADDILYVPCVDGRIYTLYARSGAPRHHVIYQVDHPLTSSPVVSDTIVAAGSGDGLLYVFDAASGRVSWLYRCRGPDQMPNEAAVHGIYAPVAASDGSLYCLTGTGNLYRFTASAHDESGPVFGDFDPEPGSAEPGGQYVAPVCSIADDGSGVDPSSVSALLDGSPTPVTFDLATGVATMRGAVLRDGSHIVKVTATDFRGNEGSTEWSFLTDASILPEETTAGQSRVQPRGQIRR
jgi:outer membrane protein assembly factor BamB